MIIAAMSSLFLAPFLMAFGFDLLSAVFIYICGQMFPLAFHK